MKPEIEESLPNIKEATKQAVDNRQVSFELLRDSISTQSKTPKFKTATSLKNVYQRHIHVKEVHHGDDEIASRQVTLASEPSMRTKHKTGLLIQQGKDKLISFGQPASQEAIKQNLMGIQHLMDNYLQFAVNSDNQYCSHMMEAILYAFEAPFLWEVRQKASLEVEGQDIPQFMFIGGVASSGKSSLVKVLMKLLGMYPSDEPLLYDDIIPDGLSRKKSMTIAQLKDWTMSENVAPLFIDEIPDEFFTNPKYGEELVVQVANATSKQQNKFPVFISTTNSSDYSFNERAQRRSYYLLSDRKFPDEYRQEAGRAYKRVLGEIDARLFNDFCVRFAQLLLNKDEAFWLEYGESSNGLYDFLRPARLIFAQYYQESGLPMPKWFPKRRYDDEQESGREKWRKLYMARPDLFVNNDKLKNRLFIKINELNANANQSRYGAAKSPADEYRNDLDSAVVIGGKNGLTIELDQQRFFNWLGIQPHKKHRRWSLFK